MKACLEMIWMETIWTAITFIAIVADSTDSHRQQINLGNSQMA